MAAVGSDDDRFQPDLLLRRLEDMLPFIEPGDVRTVARLAVKKKLIPSKVRSNLEAMHDSVTPRQKFRYFIWIMYSNKSSVDSFLSLLATLPSGKNLARDYKSKATTNPITKFFKGGIKKCNTYDCLIEYFSDLNLEKKNEPISSSNNKVICLDEKNDSFFFLMEGCDCPIVANGNYKWYKNKVSLKENSPFLCLKVADISLEGEYTMTRKDK